MAQDDRGEWLRMTEEKRQDDSGGGAQDDRGEWLRMTGGGKDRMTEEKRQDDKRGGAQDDSGEAQDDSFAVLVIEIWVF